MYGVFKDILVEVDSSQNPFSKYTSSSKTYNFLDVDDEIYTDIYYEVPQYHILKYCMNI